ncbi:hypothetical protein M0804_012735 [Polistes exclamans]|nr:hypothetical protein M0804_012735 [Polistes exclamans]
MENFEIRVLLRHYWKQQFKATEVVKKICEVEGKDVVSVRTAQKLFKKFNEGHTKFYNSSTCNILEINNKLIIAEDTFKKDVMK